MRAVARWLVVAITVIHGLLHLLGAAEGLGWANVDALEQPVTAPWGVAWLAVAGLVIVAATMLALRAPAWWATMVAEGGKTQSVMSPE